MITKKALEKLNFTYTHDLKIVGGDEIRFIPANVANIKQPSVYLWLEEINEGVFEPLYVGKAIAGTSQRLKQHEGGFTNSATGKKNKKLALELLREEKKIVVYTRIAETIKILGQEINGYSAEEEAIYEKLNPKWNRAKLASPRASTDSSAATTSYIDSGLLSLDRSGQTAEYYETLSQENQSLFEKLLSWANEIQFILDLDIRLIGGYTDQPEGCNGVPVLNVAKFNGSRAVNNSWRIRIPFISGANQELIVVLPIPYLKPGIEDIIKGNKNNFKPTDLRAFLENPKNYLTEDFFERKD